MPPALIVPLPAAVPEPWFTSRCKRLREGSREAGYELHDRYRPVIITQIRGRFPGRALRGCYGIDDIAQEIWIDFYPHLLSPDKFRTEQDLGAYLHRIIDRRYQRYMRGRMAAKRRADREEPLEARQHDRPGREPDPAEAAALAEELRFVIQHQPPLHAKFFEALREGARVAEAAEIAGATERAGWTWIKQARTLLKVRRAAQDR
jgi:DNA-directed RNA polymerase specialized sigma24 family protein